MKLIDQYKGLRKEVYILFIGTIVTRLGMMVTSMMTLILNQKLNYSAGQVSVFMFVFSIVSMGTSILGGKLADRYNKKKCIVYFDCVSIVLYMICAFIPMSFTTVVLIVIASAAQWAESPAYDSLIADITATKDRERAYALNYLGINIGFLAAPTLAGFLFKNHLSLLFVICSLSIATSTVLIALKVKNITPIVETDKLIQKRRDGDSLIKVLKDNRILIVFALATALYSAGYQQYNYLMPLDMGRLYGEDGALLYGTISSTNCLVVVIFSPIILSMFQRMRAVKKIITAEFLLLAGFGIFLAFINFIPAYYLAIILFTLGEIFAMMGEAPFLSSRSPASHRARISSFYNVTGHLMSSVLTMVVGGLYDGFGYQTSWFFVMGIMVLAILLTFVVNKMDYARPDGTK